MGVALFLFMRKTNVDITKELPTVISFCSGYGGIERGLDLAGFEHRVIAYVEIEAFAIANLVAKMETGQLPAAPIYTDLKTFPSEIFRDKVSLITGGYPCQPFSAAGQRKGTEDPRHLWPYIRKHIQSIRPLQCFFENVEGHISLGLREVISNLEEDCYGATWGIFSAREVGAPHQRKRVYILGNSEHYGSSTSEIRGGASSTSNNTTQGQNEASKSQRASQPNCGSDLSGANILADTNNTRCQQSHKKDKEEPSEQFDCNSVQSGITANSYNKGLEGRIQRGQSSKSGWQEQEVRLATKCRDRGSWDRHSAWPPEPQLGRVVDGCPDRVDRIRLLGNGVVPQTAAKAWLTLVNRGKSNVINPRDSQ